MKEPVLVIMAAGMGSRYGGLKQIDPIDNQGHIIMDFSIYDAVRAGFKKVVFIIKHQIEKDFKEVIGNRISKEVEVNYVYQEVDNIPRQFEIPADRVKPWGTGHAILSCKDVIDAPFAVINADDYYGVDAFKKIYDFLKNNQDDDKYRYAMVGYQVENTLTENGHVAIGVCEVSEDDYLLGITERTRIEKVGDGASFTEDDGKTWTPIPKNATVSMNLWGFTPSILDELESRFDDFLEKGLKDNPLKCEYFLPSVVDELINEGKATAKVLTSKDRWYGVTYHEDKQVVMDAIANFKQKGVYPEKLWGEN